MLFMRRFEGSTGGAWYHGFQILLQCMSRLMALSGGSQGGQFTSAFGGAAEVHGRTASAAFEAFDPSRKWSVHRSNRDDVDFFGGL
jgi:hypothetical protein